MSTSTLCSFYAGAPYYYEAAERLRKDCDALGIPHDIREVHLRPGETWPQVTRRKIAFIADMLEQHPEGVIWLDADSRVLKRPSFIDGGGYDFGAVLRRQQTFRDFDSWVVSRLFMPNCLQFTGSDRSRALARFLVEQEQASTVDATDDYFLQEGFKHFPLSLGVHLFDPELVASGPDKVTDATCFVYGASGQVPNYVNKVPQHTPKIAQPAVRQSILADLSKQAVDRGDYRTARVLAQEALRLDPTKAGVALAAARLHLRAGAPQKAERVLAIAFDGQAQAPKDVERAEKLRASIAKRPPSPARKRRTGLVENARKWSARAIKSVRRRLTGRRNA